MLDDIEEVDRLLSDMLWRLNNRWAEAAPEWGGICLEDMRRQDEVFRRKCQTIQNKGVDD